MKHRIFILCFLGLIGLGGWYITHQKNDLTHSLSLNSFSFLEKEEQILTFEALITKEALMQNNQKTLLRDQNHTYGSVTEQFLPFLLMDVKFVKEDKKTEEGKLLWSLENGELVLDTTTFEMTSGFFDFIHAKAKDEDFRILMILMNHSGVCSRDSIIQESGLDPELIIERLNALRARHLVAFSGDTVRIHLSKPYFKVHPITKIGHFFVTRTVTKDSKLPQVFSRAEIMHIAKAAFGKDFAIRSDTLVFVPVFLVEVKNPDGSIYKTFWNGITGKELPYNIAATL